MPHFDQIGEGGLDQVLAKRLLTPGGAVAPTVAPELFPNLTLENDRPEWGYLKGEYPCSFSRNPPAPVNVQYVLLTNLAGSGMLAVVQRIQAVVSAGLTTLYVVPTGSIASGISNVAGMFRDGRATAFAGGVFTKRSVLVTQVADAAASSVAPHARSTGLTFDYRDPIILSPGTSVILMGSNVAATMVADFAWTERRANPGEL